MSGNSDIRSTSLANLTIGRTPQPELIHAAADAGFGKVGLLLMTATAQPLQYEVLGRPQVISDIKQALRDTGIGVFDIEAFVLSPETNLEKFKPALELGAELGATHISSIGTELSATAKFLSDEQRVDLFGRLCNEAAQFGLTVGVEFMLYRDIKTWQEALYMIEAVNPSNAGLILDVLHFFRGSGTPSDIKKIPVDRIAYAQLSDCSNISPSVEMLALEARTSRLHLGDGIIPLREIIMELPKDLQLVIETPVSAELSLSPSKRAISAAQRSADFFKSGKKL
ncbi:sugar phosphate isomerase/epimerase [Pseudomonas frederiksbergensis]|uniref:sugar phosphate isomerase/epimerase family protein n=1 Tax=Pseudomonas frederiksbergensis TaxID=104087 RepID=UPI003D1E924F